MKTLPIPRPALMLPLTVAKHDPQPPRWLMWRSRAAALVILAGALCGWSPGEVWGQAGINDGAWSVGRLNAAKPEWERLLDTPLRVEGRLSSQLKGQLRLQKCELTFRYTDDVGRGLGASKHWLFSGRIKKDRDTGKLYFEIAAMQALPTEVEQLQQRERGLRIDSKPADWYALAEWAAERGALYDDKDLQAAVRVYQARGIGLEQRELAADDFEGRFQLADKVAQLKLSPPLVEELRHEAFQTWWRTIQPPAVSVERAEPLLVRLLKEWPEALQPLPNWPGDLEARYARDPMATYAAADPIERRQLHRVLGSQVQQWQLTRAAQPDGRDGAEIARKLLQAIPEKPALAEAFRLKELEYRLARIGSANRADAVAVAAELRQRQRPEQAVQALRLWLGEREKQTSKTDAPAWLALADDCWQLIQDERQTVAWLTVADQLEPESEDVATRFRELGYARQDGHWKKTRPENNPPAGVPQPTTKPVSTAVAVGMSADDLKRVLGQPPSITRILTAYGTEEVWSYGGGSGSQLVIVLQKRRLESQAKVFRVVNP